ncbi:MAG: hypothetical protein ACYDH0_09955 [Candidatus Aminicenantales bacterium]
MKKKILVIIGAVLVVLAVQSCSSKPEEGLLKRYFNAIRMNDNATMSSMALEPMTVEATGFDMVSVSPEKIEPAVLPELNAKEAELKKKVDDHVGMTLDAQGAVDMAKDELESARTGAAKRAAQAKVDELQAKYDKEFALHRDLQKEYNDAKNAAAREEEITAFSLSAKDLVNIRQLTGEVHQKEVVIKIKVREGEPKNYKLFMRIYNLKDDSTGLKHNGRWVIVKFEQFS